jgi:hypothetical protein
VVSWTESVIGSDFEWVVGMLASSCACKLAVGKLAQKLM